MVLFEIAFTWFLIQLNSVYISYEYLKPISKSSTSNALHVV
jgi:hypothetical protein